MSLGTTVILYLLIGAGVAVAVAARGGRGSGEIVLLAFAAVVFWPLFVPLLLSGSEIAPPTGPRAEETPRDELSVAIAQADAELEAALGSLDGWAEHVLSRERERIDELRAAWKAQAERVREMDRLLSRPDPEMPPPPDGETTPAAERLRQIEQVRRQNHERLRQLHAQAYNDLMGNLARVRGLASLIHLAKFTGEPAARAEELVANIAAAVEGVSGLNWQANRDSQHVTDKDPRWWKSCPNGGPPAQ